MKKKYFEPTTETAPLLLSAGIMSNINNSGLETGKGISDDGR